MTRHTFRPARSLRLFAPLGLALILTAGCGVKPTRIHREHFGSVASVSWSPDGTLILSAGSDARAIVRDARSGEPLRVLQEHDDGIHAAAFSPDGSRLATASADGRVLVHDVGTGERLAEIAPHRDEVRALAWTPDGRRIISAGDDNRVFVSDAATGETRVTITEHVHEARAVIVIGGDARPEAVSADTEAKTLVWNPDTGQVRARLEGLWGPSLAMAVGPGGETFATGDLGGQIIIWNTADLTKLRAAQLAHEIKIEAVAISPDGNRIACASADGVTLLVDAATLEPIDKLRAAREPVVTLSFSPDSTELLTGSSDSWIRIYPAL